MVTRSFSDTGKRMSSMALLLRSPSIVNDFEPISLIADCPMGLFGRATLRPKNLAELIVWLKENPGKATVGIGGAGGGADVVGTYFQKSTGTRFQFVPYRGAAPIMQDLLAGHIDLTFTQVASALAQLRAGQVQAYVVIAKSRWAEAPDTRLRSTKRVASLGFTPRFGSSAGHA
jgi:tripartite-type tricarboxylate transporter receptor subunit TctC